MASPTELLEQRAAFVKEARKIYDDAKADGDREPNAEERQKFDEIMAKVDEMKAQADTAQADIDNRSRLDDLEADLEKTRGRKTAPVTPGTPEGRKKPEVVELRDSIIGERRSIVLNDPSCTEEYRAAFNRYLVSGDGHEVRAMQKDLDTTGGYLSPSTQWMGELIKFVDDAVFIRQKARVLPPLANAESLGVPSLDTDIADSTWTTELAIGSEDSSLALGGRTLTPHPLAKLIKVSKTLLRRSALSADSLVRDRLGYKKAVTEEKAYLTGSGFGQPLGVFIDSAKGISNSQDVVAGSTTAITADGLMDVLYSLKPQYQARGEWMFHRDAIKAIRQLKDGNGQYLWSPGLTAGQPDNILTRPYMQSEFAPNTFTTGLYVGIFGDWSQYWIVDALTMTVEVLTELYAATNQVGYICRSEGDGMPVLEEAFARVTLA